MTNTFKVGRLYRTNYSMIWDRVSDISGAGTDIITHKGSIVNIFGIEQCLDHPDYKEITVLAESGLLIRLNLSRMWIRELELIR